MAYIPNLKPTNDPISYWGNCVKDKVRQNIPIISSDFVSDTSVGGTSLELAPQYRYAQIPDVYTGEWNITGSYNVGDIMRVMPDHDYIYTDLKNACYNQTMNLNITIIPWTGYTKGQILECHHLGGRPGSDDLIIPVLYVKPFPGVYRCISSVPALFDYADLYIMGVIPEVSFSGVPLFSYLNHMSTVEIQLLVGYMGNTIRLWDVNYFPIWPELPNIAYSNLSDLTKSNGRYWDLISLLPSKLTTTVCNGGSFTTTTTYFDSTNRPTVSYLNATGSFPNVP